MEAAACRRPQYERGSMITIRKLQSLPEETRLRKMLRLLHHCGVELRSGRSISSSYLLDLLRLLRETGKYGGILHSQIDALTRALSTVSSEHSHEKLIRCCSNLQAGLERVLGEEPAEWDLLPPLNADTETPEPVKRETLPLKVFLEDIRSPFNVGSLFRTAEAFGVEQILLSPATPLPTHKRSRRSAMGTVNAVPWEVMSLDLFLENEGTNNLIALEKGGTSVDSFVFPRSGTVIIGSEELGVSSRALEAAEKSCGRVTIPMLGIKNSLNVAVAFGIVMYRWYSVLTEH